MSADLLDKVLSPDEMAALRAQRADLTATETALKMHLQQTAPQQASATTASIHQAQATARQEWTNQGLQPSGIGLHGSACDPWDSAGAQLRSAVSSAPVSGSMQEHAVHSDAWNGDMADGNGFQPRDGPGEAQQGHFGSNGACWEAQGSGAWQGAAGQAEAQGHQNA